MKPIRLIEDWAAYCRDRSAAALGVGGAQRLVLAPVGCSSYNPQRLTDELEKTVTVIDDRRVQFVRPMLWLFPDMTSLKKQLVDIPGLPDHADVRDALDRICAYAKGLVDVNGNPASLDVSALGESCNRISQGGPFQWGSATLYVQVHDAIRELAESLPHWPAGAMWFWQYAPGAKLSEPLETWEPRVDGQDISLLTRAAVVPVAGQQSIYLQSTAFAALALKRGRPLITNQWAPRTSEWPSIDTLEEQTACHQGFTKPSLAYFAAWGVAAACPMYWYNGSFGFLNCTDREGIIKPLREKVQVPGYWVTRALAAA